MRTRQRYPGCQREDEQCAACSLSSYGRDCRGNPANTIAYCRSKAGLTQSALAETTGLNRSQIQKLERGEILPENITLKNALALAKALGVAPEDLLE